MKITIVGHVCIDHNISENAKYVGAGGPAMFMHTVYSQFPDVDTTIIAPHGKDFLPYAHGARLLPEKASVQETLIYENISANNKRTQKALHRESAGPVTLGKAEMQALRESSIFFLTPLLPNFSPEYVRSLVASTGKDCLRVLLPQGYFRDFDDKDNVIPRKFSELEDLLPLFQVIILSDQDYPNVEELAAEWTREHAIVVVITKGDQGCQIFWKQESIHVSVQSVAAADVIDSVGSGDVFSASFSYHYSLHHNLVQAGAFANKVARECLFYTADEITLDIPRLLQESQQLN